MSVVEVNEAISPKGVWFRVGDYVTLDEEPEYIFTITSMYVKNSCDVCVSLASTVQDECREPVCTICNYLIDFLKKV